MVRGSLIPLLPRKRRR